MTAIVRPARSASTRALGLALYNSKSGHARMSRGRSGCAQSFLKQIDARWRQIAMAPEIEPAVARRSRRRNARRLFLWERPAPPRGPDASAAGPNRARGLPRHAKAPCIARRSNISSLLAGQRCGIEEVDDGIGSQASCTTISEISTSSSKLCMHGET
jgi:hypothetical protein